MSSINALHLERADLLQLEFISNMNTLQLLPLGKNNRQKIVVGDDSGTVSCFDFKKGEPVSVFATSVFSGPVSCIALGGTGMGLAVKRDKIYAANEQKIVGITKKGKEMFSLESTLTEPIRGIHIEDTLIRARCEFICNVYDNGKDGDFYINKDIINAFEVQYVMGDNELDTILACRDNCLRIIRSGFLQLEMPTDGSVTAVSALRGSKKIPSIIVYSVERGEISCLRFDGNKSDTRGSEEDDTPYTCGWSIQDPKSSTVTCLEMFDLNQNGMEDVIVAREDGRLEVYVQDQQSGADASCLHQAAPRLAFSHDVGERIQALVCGKVNSEVYNEIVVATFSGKILSFTTEHLQKRDQDDQYGRSMATLNNENRIKALSGDIGNLRTKLEKDKAEYEKVDQVSKSSTDRKASSSSSETGVMKPASDFPSSVKFILDPVKGAYILSVEIQSALDIVVVRSPIELEVVEISDSNTIVSVTPAHLLEEYSKSKATAGGVEGVRDAGFGKCKFVAALRCPGEGGRRAQVAVRPVEGESGEIVITIVSKSSPKLAKVLKFPIKRLSLHHRLHKISESEENLPKSEVKFTGA